MTGPRLKGEFTGPECERFRRECNFTREELDVFNLRVTGCSIVEIGMELSMSESTVQRRIRGIKKKIFRVL